MQQPISRWVGPGRPVLRPVMHRLKIRPSHNTAKHVYMFYIAMYSCLSIYLLFFQNLDDHTEIYHKTIAHLQEIVKSQELEEVALYMATYIYYGIWLAS